MLEIKIDRDDLRWLDTSPKFIQKAIDKALPKIALFAEAAAKKDFTKARSSEGGLHVRTGHLRRSIVGEVDRGVVSLGTDVVYGRIHELGGSIMRGAGVIVIPRRPYLEPAFTENEGKIEDMLLDKLIAEWERQ